MPKYKKIFNNEDARIFDPIVGPFINSPKSTIGLGPISPASLLDDEDNFKPDKDGNKDELP